MSRPSVLSPFSLSLSLLAQFLISWLGKEKNTVILCLEHISRCLIYRTESESVDVLYIGRGSELIWWEKKMPQSVIISRSPKVRQTKARKERRNTKKKEKGFLGRLGAETQTRWEPHSPAEWPDNLIIISNSCALMVVYNICETLTINRRDYMIFIVEFIL